MTAITSVISSAVSATNSNPNVINNEQTDATHPSVEQESTTEDANTNPTNNNSANNNPTDNNPTDNNPTDNNPASNVTLSSRAQKVQKLNEEFFSGGPSTVKITAEFIERLYEYGLINADEAKQFGATSLSTGPTGALGELSSFAGSLSQKLVEQNPEDSFAVTLQNARSIIEQFDSAQPGALVANIKQTTREINDYLTSDQAQLLSESETQSLKQLSLALSIADRLSPTQFSSEKLSSEKINNYLGSASHY
jgi:hypothetical protein